MSDNQRFCEMQHSDHPYAKKSASEYDKEAENQHVRREESWERSDTDGFLTQWACGLSSSLARTRAQILRNGGMSKFVGLYSGNRRVKARVIETRFGCSWLLHEDEKWLISRRGKEFLPTGNKSRVLKNLGLQERPEWDLSWAAISGSGKGLSGTAWVGEFRCGDTWGGNATLLTDNEIEVEVC